MNNDIIYEIKKLHPEIDVLEFCQGNVVKVKTKYGVCKLQKYSLLQGSKPTINTALDKTLYFKQILKEIQPDLEVVSEYKGSLKYIKIKNKYGICTCIPNNLLHGQIPCIRSAENKKEYFINYAKEIHKNRYDYSDTLYINNSQKIYIKCKIHGVFEQLPWNHLKTNGCKKCGDQDKQGWWYKNPLNQSKLSNFYILRIEGNNEIFTKFGITTNIQKRINSIENNVKKQYKVTLVKSICNTVNYCFALEQKFKNKLKNENRLYTPELNFMGKNECFL